MQTKLEIQKYYTQVMNGVGLHKKKMFILCHYQSILQSTFLDWRIWKKNCLVEQPVHINKKEHRNKNKTRSLQRLHDLFLSLMKDDDGDYYYYYHY